MKLSEAILLGSTVVAPKARGQYFSESQSGCALGMAAIARGCEYGPKRLAIPTRDRRAVGTEEIWGDWVMREVVRPCDCWRLRVPYEMRIKDVIAHIFDRHVVTKKNWTLERLAAWVQTVEPAEEIVAPHEGVFDRPGFMAQIEERQRELQEWQTVMQAFEAKHSAKRRRGPAA